MTDNADRFMMEDKVTSFARAVEKKDIIVAQIGAKPGQAEKMDDDTDNKAEEADEVENDMEVDEIEPEYNELEAINNFLTASGLDPNNPSQVLRSVSRLFSYYHKWN